MMILPAFFALVKPVSTMAKPACIKNTSAAPIRNHTPNTSLVTLSATISIISSAAIFIILHFSFSGTSGKKREPSRDNT